MLIHMFVLLLWSFYHNFFLSSYISFIKKKKDGLRKCVFSMLYGST